jgi:ribonuclease T1
MLLALPARHQCLYRTTPVPFPKSLADLPKEAREVYVWWQGGPFIRPRRHRLRHGRSCSQPPHFITVHGARTGVKSRGARRLICGGQKAAPDTCYYTEDHYQSFRKIRT